MKLKLSYLLAAAVVSTTLVAHAQEKEKAAERPSREEMREKFKNMTPEERQAQIKEWREKQGQASGGPADQRRPDMAEAAKQLGINPEEMRNLTPEERRAKMTEAVDKKIVELNKKKADKTITEKEKEFLERLEARKKATERNKDGSPRKDGVSKKDDSDHKDHKNHKDGPGKKDEAHKEHKRDKDGDKPASKK